MTSGQVRRVPEYVGEKPWLRWYPEGVPAELEIPEVPFFRLFDEASERFANRTALIFYGRKIKYHHLRAMIDKFAAALHGLGLGKGSIVALYLPNCPQYAIAYFGALKAGAAITSLSPLFVTREVEYQLNDSGADAVVVLDHFYENTLKVRGNTGLKHIIVTRLQDYMSYSVQVVEKMAGRLNTAQLISGPGVHYLEDLLEQYPPSPPALEFNPKKDLMSIQYTGGTTALPKGVRLTHYNVVANVRQFQAWNVLREDGDVYLGLLPFYHIYGQVVILVAALSVGDTIVLLPRFQLEDVLRTVERYKISNFFGVPPIYVAMVNYKDLKKYNLESVKLFTTSASALALEVQKKFGELTGAHILEGYGMTELSPAAIINPMVGKQKPGSVGVPISSTVAAIATPDRDQFLPLGEVGELVVKGPQVMEGYHNRPEENARVFMRVDGETWLRTGDVGKIDEDGFFFLVDRKKDLIKYKGHSVFPREIEEVIFEHPACEDACIVGIPDPEVGENIKAIVVLKEEYRGSIPEAEIQNWCKDRLAPYKYPRLVEFREALPKTLVGKVLKRELQAEESES